MNHRGKKPSKFTVVGYYASNNQPAVFHVEATDVNGSVAAIPGISNGSDYVVVSVFGGHRQDLNESALTSCACDWPR